MPGLRVIRPADANETTQAWRLAVELDGPTALVLSRQKLPVLEDTARLAPTGVPRGGYVLTEPAPAGAHSGHGPDLVLVGTGSEVSLCVAAADLLARSGVGTRVVSLPSWELFAEQDEAYRHEVLPDGVPRLAVEAASPFGWERYADAVIAVDRFGASAPGERVLAELGFTPEHVVARAEELLARTSDP